MWEELAYHKSHRPSSQGWAPGVLPLCVYMYVYVCVFGGCLVLYLGGGFVCGGLVGGGGLWVISLLPFCLL